MTARAPKFCANAQCGNLVPAGVRYCPQCDQPWKTNHPTHNSRSADAQWRKLVKRILKRDNHRCQINYVGICTGRASEVDHKLAVAFGGTDHPSNLQAACRECHLAKSSDEGLIAQGRKPKGRIRFIPKEIQHDVARPHDRRA